MFNEYETSIVREVILSVPLLLFPSRSIVNPSKETISYATRALALRLVQVPHQEAALRSRVKIREAVGDEDFKGYLKQVDESIMKNFRLLCDFYGEKKEESKKRRIQVRIGLFSILKSLG